jgi:hypothetical protein
VTTEAEATRLLKRADPARDEDSTPFVDAASYLATLRTRSSTVTLIDTETTRPGPHAGHRRTIIAAAAAVVAILVGLLWLIARDADPSTQVPAGTTVPVDTAVKAILPLVEGTYRTEYTREQMIATGVAAGFDRADVEGFVASNSGSWETAQNELQLADGDWNVNVWLDGWRGSAAWRGTYRVVDDDTVVADGGGCGITYDYAFDGEQLSLNMVDDQCGGGLDELIAQSFYATAPYTLVEPAGDRAPATTATSVAGDGN